MVEGEGMEGKDGGGEGVEVRVVEGEGCEIGESGEGTCSLNC